MKTAFVLSGGGAKGCFQVGAINYLVRERGIVPDIVVGISTGSLQAVGFALDPSCGLLNDVWLGIRGDKDIYSKSIWRYIGNVLGLCNGLYSLRGLRKILEKHFDKNKLASSPIKCLVGHVSLQDATLRYVDNSSMEIDDIIASCTIPIAFPPVKKDSQQLVDGGVRDIVPLKRAIDEGAERIFVILCSPVSLETEEQEFKTTLDVALRTLEILLNEIFVNDLNCLERINQDVLNERDSEHRYIETIVIQPSKYFIDTLEFNPSKIREGISHGFHTAKKTLLERGIQL